jgi:hypothetical protein
MLFGHAVLVLRCAAQALAKQVEVQLGRWRSLELDDFPDPVSAGSALLEDAWAALTSRDRRAIANMVTTLEGA